MKLETLLIWAAVGGGGYYLYTKRHALGLVGPADGFKTVGAPIAYTPKIKTPGSLPLTLPVDTGFVADCQLPCPPGVMCAQALNGTRTLTGECIPYIPATVEVLPPVLPYVLPPGWMY